MIQGAGKRKIVVKVPGGDGNLHQHGPSGTEFRLAGGEHQHIAKCMLYAMDAFKALFYKTAIPEPPETISRQVDLGVKGTSGRMWLS